MVPPCNGCYAVIKKDDIDVLWIEVFMGIYGGEKPGYRTVNPTYIKFCFLLCIHAHRYLGWCSPKGS